MTRKRSVFFSTPEFTEAGTGQQTYFGETGSSSSAVTAIRERSASAACCSSARDGAFHFQLAARLNFPLEFFVPYQNGTK
jgi:hypothetical protein